MTDPIIVVGPGRCGTSCVAGVLHHLGVFMGERMLGAHPTNPYGHFEDCEFLELNIARQQRGLSREDWSRAVQQLMAKRRALKVPWGWKDPRTCNLLRDYLDLLDAPKFVRCRRDPAKIEESVMRAYGGNGWTPEEARAMRVRRERELDRYLPWYEALEIDFDSMRDNPEETVRSLVHFCGLNTVDENRMRAAAQSIRPRSAQPKQLVAVAPSPKARAEQHPSRNGRYRGWVGPQRLYDVIGALQFNLLTMAGMRESHTLLDIGCGSLRSGRLAIAYLLPGHYFGIEPESWLIEDGIRHHLGEQGVKLKQPRFSDDANFTCTLFGREFDFILAHSIFSHAAPQQIRRCLSQAAQAMHDTSLLLATYNKGQSNYTGATWVYPGAVAYTREWLHATAEQAGLACHDLSWFHPTGQSWLLLAHKDSAAHLSRIVSAFGARLQR